MNFNSYSSVLRRLCGLCGFGNCVYVQNANRLSRGNCRIRTGAAVYGRHASFHHQPGTFDSTPVRLKEVSWDQEACSVEWMDGEQSAFHHFWLRDNCHCAQCKEPSSQQKLRSCADVDLDVKPTAAAIAATGPGPCDGTAVDGGPESDPSMVKTEPLVNSDGGSVVKVTWADGHKSEFSGDWLRHQRYDAQWLERRSSARQQPRMWTAASMGPESMPTVPFDRVMGTDEGLHQWLSHLLDSGLCLVSGAPKEPGHVTRLASRAANVRRTIYGDSDWDVCVEAQPVNVAYTAVPLPAHMDLLYYELPPGIQLLHFVRTNATGGANFFVDAFAAAEELRHRCPEAFAVLTDPGSRIEFHKCDPDHWFHTSVQPIVTDPVTGQVTSVSFSPPFEAPLRVPYARMRPLYRAYGQFMDVIRDPALTVRRRFESGDVITFNNRRVFHGRELIDLPAPTEDQSSLPHRLLQGCYIDLDEASSKHRVLTRKLSRGK